MCYDKGIHCIEEHHYDLVYFEAGRDILNIFTHNMRVFLHLQVFFVSVFFEFEILAWPRLVFLLAYSTTHPALALDCFITLVLTKYPTSILYQYMNPYF